MNPTEALCRILSESCSNPRGGGYHSYLIELCCDAVEVIARPIPNSEHRDEDGVVWQEYDIKELIWK